MKNYFKLLNVSPTASDEEIKKAINKELRVWSNRTNAPQIERRQEAERMIKDLEEAEKILLDPAKKSEYERNLKTAPSEERKMDESDLKGKEDLVKEGWQLLIAGNVPDALYVATKATEKEGNNPEAWALLAQAKFRWGMNDDAIYEYKRAIKLRPNEAEYYFDLGSVYETVEKWKDAVENYERASKVKPEVPMYRASIGSVYVRLDMHKEAIPILEKCVSEEPSNDTFNWFLAIAYEGYVLEDWHKGNANLYSCTSESAGQKGVEYFTKALALKFREEDTRAELQRFLELSQLAVSKQWSRNTFNSIKGGAIVLVIVLASFASGNFMAMIIGIGIAAGWVFLGMKPGWKINKEALGLT